MSGSINAILRQVSMATRLRGCLVTLRRATTTGGPAPLQIPPILEAPVIMTSASVGASQISIAAESANGALAAGDKITTLDGSVYAVTAQTASTGLTVTPAGILNIPISPNLAVAVNAGDAVQLSYAADQQVYANVNSFSIQQVDGDIIQASDMMITMPAWDSISGALISPAPQDTDKIVFNGNVLQIISAIPQFIGGQVMTYRIQARA